MNERNSILRPPIGAGILTILMVLVILLLSSFAVMSLLSANADKKLTEKAIFSIGSYYEADSKAERMVLSIDEAIRKGSDWSKEIRKLGVAVTIEDNHAILSFSVPIEGGGRIDVVLTQPLKAGKPRGTLTRKQWQSFPKE